MDTVQNGSGATYSLLPPDNATGNFTKIVQRVPVKIVFDTDDRPASIKGFEDLVVPGLSCEPVIDLSSASDRGDHVSKDQPAPPKDKNQRKRGDERVTSFTLCAVAALSVPASLLPSAVTLLAWRVPCRRARLPRAAQARTPDPTRFKNAVAGNARVEGGRTARQGRPGPLVGQFSATPTSAGWKTPPLANNQDLRLALARIDESRAQTRVAASDFYPHFDFDGSYARERTSSNEPYQRGQLVGPNPYRRARRRRQRARRAGQAAGRSRLTQQPLTRTFAFSASRGPELGSRPLRPRAPQLPRPPAPNAKQSKRTSRTWV